MKLSALLILSSALSCASATLSTKRSALVTPSLLARQTGGINNIPDSTLFPEQCTNQCQGLINAFSSCGTNYQCLCTSSFNRQITTCLDCSAGVTPSILGDLQVAAIALEQQCSDIGANIGTINVTPSRSNAALNLVIGNSWLAVGFLAITISLGP